VTIDDTATTALTGHLTRTPGETVAGGPYAITQGTLAASNYTVTFKGSTLTITAAPLTITSNSQTKVYGAADPTLTDTATGFVDTTVDGVTIDDTAATALTGGLARTPGETVSGGPYAITQGTLAADSNYTLGFTGSTLTITPAPLTVTANSQTKVYGTADPTLTETASGFVDTKVDGVAIDDTAATALTGHLTRTPGETVSGGPYAITQGTLAADSNYKLGFTGSTLAITPATLTVTANPQTKVFGHGDPALTVTPAGLVDTTVDGVAIDDTAVTVLTGAPARTQAATLAGEQVGDYAITQGTLAASSNYKLSFTGSTLAITPATLTVTANPQTKVYGSADPTLTETVTGFVDATVDGVMIADTAATVLTGQLSRTPGETVSGGPYAITQGTLAASSNYTIAFTAGTLTITPATLIVTAKPATMAFGSADPALAYTAGGFQFDDTAATVLSGHLSRAAGQTVAGGPYAVTQGTLAANSNYTIKFTGSTLTISPATPVVTETAPGGTYTGAPIAATASVTGLGGPATPDLEGVTPTLTYYAGSGTSGTNLGSLAPSAAGTFTVVARFPGSADFAPAQSKPTTFTIAPARATIVLVPHAVLKGKKTLEGVELTAEIEPVAPGGGVPTGQVIFEFVTKRRNKVKVTTLGTAALSGGRATLTFKPDKVLEKPLTIVYSGGPDFLASTMSPPKLTKSGIASSRI
jgi:large repetitive protein